jgi:hypothetical protein
MTLEAGAKGRNVRFQSGAKTVISPTVQCLLILKVFNSIVLDDPRQTVYKKVNRGCRETDSSQVYFG